MGYCDLNITRANMDRSLDKNTRAMQDVAKQMKAMCTRTEEITEKMSKQHIPTPTFDGHGDVHLFINRFKETGRLNGWGEDEKLLRFKMAISGPAATETDDMTFEEISDQLIKRYTLTEAAASQLLRSLKWRSGDSIYEYADYVQKLVRFAFPELSKEQKVARSIREIVSTLPTNYSVLQWQLTHTKPATLKETISMIQEIGSLNCGAVKVNAVDTEVVELRSAVATMTQTQEELTKAVAAISTSVAALASQVQQSNRSRSRKPLSELECYNCRKFGHLQRDCPSRRQGNDNVQQA